VIHGAESWARTELNIAHKRVAVWLLAARLRAFHVEQSNRRLCGNER
jgi:hypothetical protein